MMARANIRMKTRVKTSEVLEILKRNLAEHKRIVEEATVKYKEHVIKEMEARLKAAQEGKPVAAFSYNPPTSFATIYRTAIRMFEMCQDETVVLEADEFRQLVLDEWDWMANFLSSNRAYSNTAAMKYRATLSAEDAEDGGFAGN